MKKNQRLEAKKVDGSPDPKVLSYSADNGKSNKWNSAVLATEGAANSSSLAKEFSSLGELYMTETFHVIKAKADKVVTGDLTDAKKMLISQAIALDSIFTSLALRAKLNIGQNMLPAVDIYMKLALKAQNQSQRTLLTLAEVTNPRPYIQNNRANYQQVNNGLPAQSRAQAEKPKQSNELLEDKSNEWLDNRAPQETVGNDTALEAVGEKHGT